MSIINIHYEKDTLPDLLKGETEKDSVKQILDISMTDIGMTSYCEFMGEMDKKMRLPIYTPY